MDPENYLAALSIPNLSVEMERAGRWFAFFFYWRGAKWCVWRPPPGQFSRRSLVITGVEMRRLDVTDLSGHWSMVPTAEVRKISPRALSTGLREMRIQHMAGSQTDTHWALMALHHLRPTSGKVVLLQRALIVGHHQVIIAEATVLVVLCMHPSIYMYYQCTEVSLQWSSSMRPTEKYLNHLLSR